MLVARPDDDDERFRVHVNALLRVRECARAHCRRRRTGENVGRARAFASAATSKNDANARFHTAAALICLMFGVVFLLYFVCWFISCAAVGCIRAFDCVKAKIALPAILMAACNRASAFIADKARNNYSSTARYMKTRSYFFVIVVFCRSCVARRRSPTHALTRISPTMYTKNNNTKKVARARAQATFAALYLVAAAAARSMKRAHRSASIDASG